MVWSESGEEASQRLATWVIERCMHSYVRHRLIADKSEELIGEGDVQVMAYR